MPSGKPKPAAVEDCPTERDNTAPISRHVSDYKQRKSSVSQNTDGTFSDSGYSSHTHPSSAGKFGAEAPIAETIPRRKDEGPSSRSGKTSSRTRDISPLRRTTSLPHNPRNRDCDICHPDPPRRKDARPS